MGRRHESPWVQVHNELIDLYQTHVGGFAGVGYWTYLRRFVNHNPENGWRGRAFPNKRHDGQVGADRLKDMECLCIAWGLLDVDVVRQRRYAGGRLVGETRRFLYRVNDPLTDDEFRQAVASGELPRRHGAALEPGTPQRRGRRRRPPRPARRAPCPLGGAGGPTAGRPSRRPPVQPVLPGPGHRPAGGRAVARRWTDRDEGSRTLLVQTKFERETGLGIVEGPTKARRPRSSVPVSEHAVGVLRVHADHQAEEKRHAGSAYQDDGLIWCWEDGGRYDPNWISGHFRRLRKRLGWPKAMHFHDLRQTSATLAIAKGEPLKVTQERLGQASPATTLAMYGHATPEMHGEAADRRGGLLGTRDFTPKAGRRHRRSGRALWGVYGEDASTAPGSPCRRSRNPLRL